MAESTIYSNSVSIIYLTESFVCYQTPFIADIANKIASTDLKLAS